MNVYLWALLGTGFPFLMTAAGSALVFLFKKPAGGHLQKAFLGFAAGVMVAASVWSLLIPAIEDGEAMGLPGWLPAAVGFVAGGLFLFLLDQLLPHLHLDEKKAEGLPTHWKKTTLLISAVTLHNIPEGMAVGLSFALAAQQQDPALLSAAMALGIGIGIQNFPEGAAISLPLRQEGFSRRKAFAMGTLSGLVEPVFGMLTVLATFWLGHAMPWLLSFAAGAMIYVVVEELIPEAHLSEHTHIGTMGFMIGFLIMMILDVALG